MTKTTGKNQVDNVQAFDLEASIRQAIEASMAEQIHANSDKLAQLDAEYATTQREAVETQNEIDRLRSALIDKKSRLKDIDRACKAFRCDAEVIDQRVSMALAAARGETVKKPRRSGGPRKSASTARNVAYDVTIDGKPRSFHTLTHLTYWLSQKGDKVTMDDLRGAFENQAGTRLFSADHDAAGMIFADINGFQVGIAMVGSDEADSEDDSDNEDE